VKPLLALAALSLATIAFSQDADCDSMEKCQEALKTNRRSSLTHFRVAEFYFRDKNYQSSANEFREALNGDLEPKWTEVWAHINLGKIFDLTGQRERALNEYRLARRTGDNTRGAQEEAAKYSEEPYKGG
jgi:tetratricopeptide (TPR) repeat protein